MIPRELLPPDWSMVPLRRLLRKLGRPVRDTDKVVTAYRDGRVTARSIRREEGYTLSDSEAGYQGVEPGDLVFHALDGFAGAVGVSDSRGKCSPVYHVCSTLRDGDPRFYAYVLRAMSFAGFLEVQAGNVRQRSVDFRTWETFARLPVPLPPVSEQYRIADFLDSETARIDALIARKSRLIELSLERVIAIIDEEVNGLFAQYGEYTFRRAIGAIEQGESPQCDNFPAHDDEWGVLKVSSIKDGHFWPHENKRLPYEVAPDKRYEIAPGDLLITRANTPVLVGAVALVPSVRAKLLLCDKIFRVSTSGYLDKSFLVYVARGSRIRDLCAASSHGTSQSMTNLKSTDIKEWPIPDAPLSVQRESAERISAKLARVTQLRKVISQQLELLSEHRQALITAAVTRGRGTGPMA